MVPASLTILADHREARSGIARPLARLGIEIVWTGLECADYVLGAGVAVERKTVPDLHESVRSGRLWRQLTAMERTHRSVFLVVEGRSIDAGCLSREGVRGAVLEVLSQGVPVLWAADSFDSALWLQRLSARARRPASRRRALRRAYRNHITPAAMLSTVPGISPVTASRLIDRFGSIGDIARARPEDLQALPGIGAVRATTLSRLLSERFPAERESA